MNRLTLRPLLIVLALTLFAASAAVPASAATSMTVDLEPANASAGTGGQVTVDVVLQDVDNGVGSFSVSLSVAFDNRNSDAVQNNPDVFDFNNQGGFDIVDIQRLFKLVLNS